MEREWAGGPSPLPLCGQLTRCFSAVAELLVEYSYTSAYARISDELLELLAVWGLGLWFEAEAIPR